MNITIDNSMESFTLSELGVFLGVVGGIITSILLTIQKSKCDKLKCCGLECHRKVPDKSPQTPSPRGAPASEPQS